MVDINHGLLEFLADIDLEEMKRMVRSDATLELLVRAANAVATCAKGLKRAWGLLAEDEKRAEGQLVRALVVLLTAAARAGVPVTKAVATLSGHDDSDRPKGDPNA